MRPIVVDTSTLITLALATEERAIAPGNIGPMRARYGGGLDGAISAMVLYEDLVVDQSSVSRNIQRLPSLERIRDITATRNIDVDENTVYAAVARIYLSRLDPNAHLNALAMLEADLATTAEVGTSAFGPAGAWREVESELSGAAAELARQLREMFGAYAPTSGAACATLLRSLYYDYLHQAIGADLIVHPAKAAVREPQSGAPVRILDAFDKDVRTAFAARRKRWFGDHYLSFQVPLLTEYVLGRCKNWHDLPNVVSDLRESKRAAGFRRGVSDLLFAAALGNNKDVNRELEQLDAVGELWQRELGGGATSKTLSLSLPFLPISSDWDVPDMKLNPRPSDRILSFVHLLLETSVNGAA